MKIRINGNTREFDENLSVAQLIAHLRVSTRGLIVEINGSVIGLNTYDNTVLSDGDRVEFIRFVGGG